MVLCMSIVEIESGALHEYADWSGFCMSIEKIQSGALYEYADWSGALYEHHERETQNKTQISPPTLRCPSSTRSEKKLTYHWWSSKCSAWASWRGCPPVCLPAHKWIQQGIGASIKGVAFLRLACTQMDTTGNWDEHWRGRPSACLPAHE